MNTYAVSALTALVLGLVVLVLLVGRRPSLTAACGGKVLAFLGFFILPVLATWGGPRFTSGTRLRYQAWVGWLTASYSF